MTLDGRVLAALTLPLRLWVSAVATSHWVYDSVEQRLLLESDNQHDEVLLSPQQHRLLAYMSERNQVDGGRSVLCDRAELIRAIWGDEPGHGPQDLAYVVHQLRGRVDSGPELIVNERGRGYRLLVLRGPRPADEHALAPPSRGIRRRLLMLGGAGLAAALATSGLAIAALSNRSAPEPILREGSRGQDVVALQRDLRDLGYDPVYVDGQFGPLTAGAVRRFQEDNGLVVDGEVGPDTRSSIRQALEHQRSVGP